MIGRVLEVCTTRHVSCGIRKPAYGSWHTEARMWEPPMDGRHMSTVNGIDEDTMNGSWCIDSCEITTTDIIFVSEKKSGKYCRTGTRLVRKKRDRSLIS